jgi:hypothetical protein
VVLPKALERESGGYVSLFFLTGDIADLVLWRMVFVFQALAQNCIRVCPDPDCRCVSFKEDGRNTTRRDASADYWMGRIRAAERKEMER